MNDDRKELKQIELKLDDLMAKQLVLQKKQTLYQRFFALTGIGFTLKAVWKSYNIGKAAEAIERKLEEDVGVFTHRAGFNNEKQILWAMKSRHRFIATAA
jgi:hypothetical protein